MLERLQMPVCCVATASELYRHGGSRHDQQLLCDAIQLAQRLGASRVNTYFGCSEVADDARAINSYMDYLEPCLEMAEQKGIIICLENEYEVPGTDPAQSNITRRPESLLQLFEEVGHPLFRHTFNPAAYYRAGIEPFPYAYDLLAPYIAHVRVQDVQAVSPDKATESQEEQIRYRMCTIGKGALNWTGMLQRLEADGYEGYLCLEPRLSTSRRYQAWQQAMQYLQARMQTAPAKAAEGFFDYTSINASRIRRVLNTRRN